jgi:hypothetical protein
MTVQPSPRRRLQFRPALIAFVVGLPCIFASLIALRLYREMLDEQFRQSFPTFKPGGTYIK